jgi:putative acetyltransferase
LWNTIRQTNRYIPELELVAEMDCGVVGHILFSCIDRVGQEKLRVISLAPMAVRPEFQGQGFGSALVRAGLDTASSLGESIVIHDAVYCTPHHFSQMLSYRT